MKPLTLLKNSVWSAICVLQEPSLPQQLDSKDLSLGTIEREQQSEPNPEENSEDITRPSKRPRISVPEPAHHHAGVEAGLLKMLHSALGLRDVVDLGDLSLVTQMNL
jgi:hypothetical protein